MLNRNKKDIRIVNRFIGTKQKQEGYQNSKQSELNRDKKDIRIEKTDSSELDRNKKNIRIEKTDLPELNRNKKDIRTVNRFTGAKRKQEGNHNSKQIPRS